jgi:hypothetical protein
MLMFFPAVATIFQFVILRGAKDLCTFSGAQHKISVYRQTNRQLPLTIVT